MAFFRAGLPLECGIAFSSQGNGDSSMTVWVVSGLFVLTYLGMAAGGIRGLEYLQQRVDSGDYRVAFSLFPVSIQQLFDIADTGNVMPPKSTWFEPKLRDGILQLLFDHANTGGFQGSFTDADNLVILRKGLTEVARSVLGSMVRNVLITDMIRQDS